MFSQDDRVEIGDEGQECFQKDEVTAGCYK